MYSLNLRGILLNINKYIDQTLLKYNVTEKDYVEFVNRSAPYNFRSLVVPSTYVKLVSSISTLPVAGVAGFPYGYHTLSTKLKEIEDIASGGGKEVDVVININNVKSGKWKDVRGEVKALVRRAHELGLGIKIIVETSVLNDEELRNVSRILIEEGADSIKTNSGYGPRGVSLRDVFLIKRFVGNRIRIKASGGIRDPITAATLIALGADILGTSSGIQIVEDAKKLLMYIR
ncbi:MAG TPA: deoxyribose-phosphate aldolase [Acidilobales archaeon]|nr:deoxyribose-phosphate aldolase [Acidilobales archaeon]